MITPGPDLITEAITEYASQPLPEKAEDLARLLVTCREITSTARLYEKQVEGALVKAMDGRRLEVPGAGVFDKMPGSRRKDWDHPRIVAKLSQEALARREVEGDTGEVQAPEEAVAAAFLRCAAVSYWRVGELGTFGLEADQFCAVERGPQTIKHTI